jgi:hypothetical protein
VQFLVVLLVLTAIVVFITVPLRRRHVAESSAAAEAERVVDDLEAAREAKYREIRDAELDHGTGKLSDADFAAVDRALRAEAIEILKALDSARERYAAAESAGDPEP